MGASMFIQFKLNPTPPDPMQARVTAYASDLHSILPVPAGLVRTGSEQRTSIAQQYVITKQIEKSRRLTIGKALRRLFCCLK